VSDLQQGASKIASSIAKEIGIADFYVAHSLNYCEGYYVPGPVPNATLSAGQIKMNITNCTSLGKADFVPGDAIQATLNKTGTGLTLADLDWNTSIDDKVRQYQKYIKAFLILYAIGTGLSFLAFVLSIVWLFEGHRSVAAITGVLSFLAFLAIGIASALVTVVKILGDNAINKYGKDIGITANTSIKMLGISWAGTACILIATLFGCFGICCGASARRHTHGKNHY
jgi:hypothetical protein